MKTAAPTTVAQVNTMRAVTTFMQPVILLLSWGLVQAVENLTGSRYPHHPTEGPFSRAGGRLMFLPVEVPMRQLTFYQGRQCQQAKGSKCTCRCAGQYHGKDHAPLIEHERLKAVRDAADRAQRDEEEAIAMCDDFLPFTNPGRQPEWE